MTEATPEQIAIVSVGVFILGYYGLTWLAEEWRELKKQILRERLRQELFGERYVDK